MTVSITPTQRRLIAAAMIFAFLALGCATRIMSEENSAEKANIKVVDDFIAAWSNPDAAVQFLAPEAAVRMIEDQPALVGRTAIGAAFKGFLTPGVSLTVETLQTTAQGPVVMNKRIDTMKTTDKPDQVFPVVGVFVVKNGQITEWVDYLDK